MPAIGVFSDTGGDLPAFDAALAVLGQKGARRFLFAGGRYDDLDGWVKWKREAQKGEADYGHGDFLEDVSRYLLGLDQLPRPAAFGQAWEGARAIEELTRLKDKVLRTPERGSLAYQDPKIPKVVVDLIGDTLCCLAHDKNELTKDDMLNALVFIHGKESEPKVVHIGPRAFITPGRALGVLEVVDRQLSFAAYDRTGAEVLPRQALQVGSKAKVSVK